MADSNITKKALADALKHLMNEMTFEKITVSHICDRCDMNRKSFYYHFKDKYDLVNWIFDTEFITAVQNPSYRSGWEYLEGLCTYLYDNRNFYRRALQIKGQNSFSEHFREMLFPVITTYLQNLYPDSQITEFHTHFIVDGFICAIERWIMDRNCMMPDTFLDQVKHLIEMLAVRVYQEIHT